MAGYLGGSAWAMARDIAEGHILLTDRTVLRMTGSEADKLAFEMNRRLRELRGMQLDLDDHESLRHRNRRISRLTSALSIVRGARKRR